MYQKGSFVCSLFWSLLQFVPKQSPYRNAIMADQLWKWGKQQFLFLSIPVHYVEKFVNSNKTFSL